jgi:hypothetical protein
MKMIDTSFVVSMLAFVCILFGGGFLFHSSEAGMTAIVVIAFGVGSTVLVELDMRSGRIGRRKR